MHPPRSSSRQNSLQFRDQLMRGGCLGTWNWWPWTSGLSSVRRSPTSRRSSCQSSIPLYPRLLASWSRRSRMPPSKQRPRDVVLIAS